LNNGWRLEKKRVVLKVQTGIHTTRETIQIGSFMFKITKSIVAFWIQFQIFRTNWWTERHNETMFKCYVSKIEILIG